MPKAARRLRDVIQSLSPELVHAMRIPYEGMIAALAKHASQSPPLVISTWGNDFTLHAGSTPLMARYTRTALGQADALHTDCFRDARLARQWGFDEDKPALTVPGNIQKPGLFVPPWPEIPMRSHIWSGYTRTT
jgi:hypothetical protein